MSHYFTAMEELVTSDYLREQADKCRRYCRNIDDKQTIDALLAEADDYEARALMLESQQPKSPE